MGKGRVVAFGHTGYLDPESLEVADTARLMANAIGWASEGSSSKAGAMVGVYKQARLTEYLQRKGIRAEPLADLKPESLARFNVLCLNPSSLVAARESEAVTAFVRNGGGLIVASLGWGWLQLNPGKSLRTDHPGNSLLSPADIIWADGTLKRTTDSGFSAGKAPAKLAHAARALEAVQAPARSEAKPSKHDLAQAAAILTHAARTLPPNDKLLLPKLRRFQKEHAGAIPTADKPLAIDRPTERLALALQIEEMKVLRPEEINAHPAAATFPGEVPASAKRVTRTIEIDTRVPNWHSTGLYAPPGEVVTVRVPETAVGKKLTVRIGAHSDSLWALESWKRCPEICRVEPIKSPVVREANAFGGLIYIDVPQKCGIGNLSVEISGAVEAPHYILDKTDLNQWRSQIRRRPAPWAELETKKVILTVPSKVVRKLDNPKEVMEFWDRVLDSCAELAGRPLDRERPERYVTDVQISAGYMHAGYPIMTWLDQAPIVTDLGRMKEGQWGLFHEMGHNHQSRDWTFEGAGEVTENLFTLYVFDTLCGKAPRQLRNFDEAGRSKMMRKYFGSGGRFEDWKRDPFLALLMYIQLQEAFGWDAFKSVFAEYRDLPAVERPKDDDGKRDEWMVRFSHAVGRNLGPFFKAWGVPTSEKARSSIANLPLWMPKDFPPK
jgi:hypothetical protein